MIPTPHTVQHYTHIPGPMNSHGNAVDTYTPPKNEPGTPRKVAGWSGASTSEPPLAGHNRAVVILDLLVPKGFPAVARDLIRIMEQPDAGLYKIDGGPRNYTAGPFKGPLGHGWGYVLTLRRVDG